jgi:hypothetical protein
MGVTKMKIAAAVFVAVAVLAGGGGALTYRSGGAGTQEAWAEAPAQGPGPKAGVDERDRELRQARTELANLRDQLRVRDEQVRLLTAKLKEATKGAPPAPGPVMVVIGLEALQAAEMAREVRKMMSPKGTVGAAEGVNALMVYDTPANVERITRIVRAVDKKAAVNLPHPKGGPPRPGSDALEQQKARDEVELLEAQLAVKRAQLAAAKAAVEPAQERLRALDQSMRVVPKSVSVADYMQARAALEAAKAQVAIREAELLEPMVRLKQAQRRLAPPRPAPAPHPAEERLRELEQKLDGLRQEVEALRRDLRKAR